MLKAGFIFQDIEKLYKEYDIRTFNSFILEALKNEKKHRLTEKLNIAEAINFGYSGSKPSKGKKTQREYAKWQSKLLKEIAKLEGRKSQTVWQRIRGTGKRKSIRF